VIEFEHKYFSVRSHPSVRRELTKGGTPNSPKQFYAQGV